VSKGETAEKFTICSRVIPASQRRRMVKNRALLCGTGLQALFRFGGKTRGRLRRKNTYSVTGILRFDFECEIILSIFKTEFSDAILCVFPYLNVVRRSIPEGAGAMNNPPGIHQHTDI